MGGNQSSKIKKTLQVATGAAGGAIVGRAVGKAVQEGVIYAANSIFGKVTAGAIVKCITSTTICGAPVIIAAMTIVGAAVGGYYVYTRLNRASVQNGGRDFVDQGMVQVQGQQESFPESLPQFQEINMDRNTFENLLRLTEEQFTKDAQKYICPLSSQVMRIPAKMNCCKKYGEKQKIQQKLRTTNQCPFCMKRDTLNELMKKLTQDRQMVYTITGLRTHLVKVYLQATDEDKKKWEELIDGKFGMRYTQKHLKNFIVRQVQ